MDPTIRLAGALASAGYASTVLLLLPTVMLLSQLVGRWAEQTAPALGDAARARGIGRALPIALGGATTVGLWRFATRFENGGRAGAFSQHPVFRDHFSSQIELRPW